VLSGKTRKKTRATKRKKKQKNFAPKPNSALKLKDHENDGKKNEILHLNPCLTSTPKEIRRKETCQTLKDHENDGKTNEILNLNPCLTSTPKEIRRKETCQTSQFLSPIPHSVDKGHGRKATDEIVKEENDSYQVPLPKPHVHTFDATGNISPEMCQLGPSCKASNTFSAPSVVDGKPSSSLCKFSVHKLDSPVATSAMLGDSVGVTDVPSQLQSREADESIVYTIHHLPLKGSFVYKDQKLDSAKQLLMNDSVNGVSMNGSFLSPPVHRCKNVNLRRQTNRDPKYKEGALYTSDDSYVEDFLGFSDVPPAQNLCENTGKDSVLSNSSPTHDSNQFSVINRGTEKCEVNGNLSPSKSRNMSLILFDSWDSVNGRKSGATPESKVCNQNQVLQSEILSSHSERLLYPDHTDLAVQGSEEGSWRINDSGSHPTQESSVLSRDTGLLCSNVSRSPLLQESSVDACESHVNNRNYSVHNSAVYNTVKGEVLCNSISKNDILIESTVLNSGTGKSHVESMSFPS
jgi:hypothetical protein